MPLFNGRPYNPSQLLSLCKVDGLAYANLDGIVAQILALVVTEKDQEKLREKLKTLVRQLGESASIGRSLDELSSVASMDASAGLDGDLDGLDALTYHLGADQCRKGIAALQAVLKRFAESPEDQARRLPMPEEGKFYIGTSDSSIYPGIVAGPYDREPSIKEGQFRYVWNNGKWERTAHTLAKKP